MIKLHLLLCLLILIVSSYIIKSANPVESVLFLIISFCIAAAQLIIFEVDFLGIAFIIIYVGAIAILFLFVIMMINIKESLKIRSKNYSYSYVNVIHSFVFLSINTYFGNILLEIYKDIEFYTTFISLFGDYSPCFETYDLQNIEIIGQALFNYYLMLVVSAGLILLLSLLGAVCLTAIFKTFKPSLTAKQLARAEYFLSFFKRKNTKEK
jgi:NADH:ubiquinone oxidoreductase subunit 6 (subunit J)